MKRPDLPRDGVLMVSIKNVTTEPVFTIEKQCDRCRNVLYFSDTVITDIELDASGKVVYSSVACPICGHVIVLYSDKSAPTLYAGPKRVSTGGDM